MLSLIERNVRSCALTERAKIIKWNITKNLNCIVSAKPTFDLVFMDPPYDKDCIRPSLFNLLQSNALAKNACIVIEHSPAETIPEGDPAFRIRDQRKYGKTLVSFIDYMV